MPIAKFAYYGNPDAKSAAARLRFAREHGEVDIPSMLLQAWDNRSLERAHLRQMKKYPMLGDVAANDAEYYASHGHPNAFYVRNLWIDRQPGDLWRSARRAREQKSVIIGNIGRLPGTGNTLGLELLGRDLLPLLRERLSGQSYKVRILGAGSLHPKIAPYFETPEVDMAGFVPDIDEAILEAGVFLCLNNASHFKVGQTRYLHAWSLGACIVAHRDAALSMPEIRHNKNALLGDSIAEIADLVKQAIGDDALRRRIGEAGYDTFVKLFTAESVAHSIVERIGGR
jgi:glycosyltransferase involved in cell wall biosynthesis